MTFFSSPAQSRVTAIALGTITTALMATPALAHGSHIEYEVVKTEAGPTVQVSAAYDTQEPMVKAQGSIYSPANPQTPWLTGMTDGEGRFEFTPDRTGNWDIKVRQAGHGALVTLPWSNDAMANAAGDSSTTLTSSALGAGRPLPQWLGLGLGVAGCLGAGWLLMRRSPQSAKVEIAD